MSMRRFTAGMVAATVLGAAGAMVSSAASAEADAGSLVSSTTIYLRTTSAKNLVVDSAVGRVFISTGTAGNSIIVTDMNGAAVSTLSGVNGADQMVLSDDGSVLYVELDGQDEVAAYNTATLEQTELYSLGVQPSFVAFAGNEIWFTTTSSLYVNELNLSTAAVTTTAARNFYYGEGLVSSPSAPGVLVAGTHATSPSTMEIYNVSSGAPVLVTSTLPASPPICPDLGGMSISSDGKDLLTTCGWAQSQATAFSLADFTVDDSYTTSGLYTGTPIESASGEIAITSEDFNTSTEDLDLFNQGVSAAVTTLNPSDGMFSPAWSADGGLYGLGTLGWNVSYENVLEIYRSATAVAVNAPTVTHPGDSFTITGQITSASAFGTLPAVTVTEQDNPAAPDAAPAVVGQLTADSNGDFSFTATAGEAGYPEYVFTFAGDGDHSAATGTANLTDVPVVLPITRGSGTVNALPGSVPAPGHAAARTAGFTGLGTSAPYDRTAVGALESGTLDPSAQLISQGSELNPTEAVAHAASADPVQPDYAAGIGLALLLSAAVGIVVRRRAARI